MMAATPCGVAPERIAPYCEGNADENHGTESRRRPVRDLDVQLDSHRRRVRPGAVHPSRPIPSPGAGTRGRRGLSVAIGPECDRKPARRPARDRVDPRGCVRPLRADRLPGREILPVRPEVGILRPRAAASVCPAAERLDGDRAADPSPPSPPKPGEKPRPTPPSPWKPLFYNNDFRYLDRPDNPFHDPFDFLKRISPTPSGNLKVDVGGEFRWQGRGEDNRRLTGEQNNFNLFREKLYLDAWYRDRFRMFVDVFWADASRQNAPPSSSTSTTATSSTPSSRPSSSRSARGPCRAGSARVSNCSSATSGWSRRWTGRTAPGRSTTWRTGSIGARRWTSTSSGPGPTRSWRDEFDKADSSRQFFGAYLVYKGIPNQTVDLYYLGLLESDPLVQGRNGALGDFAVHTLGTRWQGSREDWLWEVETAYQFGHQSNLTRNAGMATGGLGRAFSKWWARPELWFYYDYASGTQNPGDGYATFNQLFPLGHKYFGYMDIVGRQNILDPNVVMKFYPSKRVNFLLWYHHFNLASARDSLYNAAGAAIRTDPTGRAGTYVGDELDIAINLILNPHADWQFGVSHFWAGPFVERTATTPAQARDGSFFYTQFMFRF